MNLGWRRQHATPHLLQSTASQYSACTRGGACSRPRLISVDSGHTSPPPVDSLAVLSMYSGQCAQHATPHLLQLIASQCSAHGIRCRAIAPLPRRDGRQRRSRATFPIGRSAYTTSSSTPYVLLSSYFEGIVSGTHGDTWTHMAITAWLRPRALKCDVDCFEGIVSGSNRACPLARFELQQPWSCLHVRPG